MLVKRERVLWLLAVFAACADGLPVDSKLIDDLPREECAQVIGCTCATPRRLDCSGVAHDVFEQMAIFYPLLNTLTITNFAEESLNLTRLANLTKLATLRITDSYLTTLDSDEDGSGPPNLGHLDLRRNTIENWTLAMCSWIDVGALSRLRTLDVRENQLSSIDECRGVPSFQVLDANDNKIARVDANLSRWKVKKMSLAGNALVSLTTAAPTWTTVDLAVNPLENLTLPPMPNLESLNISRTNLFTFPVLRAPRLRVLKLLECERLSVIDILPGTMPSLDVFEMNDLPNLIQVTGVVPPRVTTFYMTGTPRLNTLPTNFFESATSLSRVELSQNNWSCLKCSPLWERPLREKFGNLSGCTEVTVKEFPPDQEDQCDFGIKPANSELVYGRYGSTVTVPCQWYGSPPPLIEWWLYRPATLIGSYNAATHNTTLAWSKDGSYEILPGGALVIHHLTRAVVERYTCIVQNSQGVANATSKVRLDYSFWYGPDIFHSVFWGSVVCSLLVCAASFVLNILWIISKKSILWWIRRAERLSRVRKMVEAMEKYRVRQIENLHELYAKRMQAIRENYHHQVEALRSSYAWQAGRFRDYRTQQMENVTAHLDTIRENYNQQVSRLRDYGSRRADQLWESYDRQVNRVRTFSLQNRMKLQRQYKVKQRYLNKLLESFNQQWNPDAMREHEAEVRAALEMHEVPPMDMVEEIKEPDDDKPGPSMSRASSFYSLPEYVIDDDGKLHSPPMSSIMKRFDDRHHRKRTTSNSLSSPKPTDKLAVMDKVESKSEGTGEDDDERDEGGDGDQPGTSTSSR